MNRVELSERSSRRQIFTIAPVAVPPLLLMSPNREILNKQHVHTFIGLIAYWIQSDYKYSAKYMTEQMMEIAKLYYI